jgi:hypothetical protein
MKIKQVSLLITFVGLTALLTSGCTGGSDVSVKQTPTVVAPPPKPVPADVKKGGGKTSSGNMNRNPGASS